MGRGVVVGLLVGLALALALTYGPPLLQGGDSYELGVRRRRRDALPSR
ncbi:hypothetical protein [Angustibacter sp. Root456]|nr:hypothetical protein [Angustibacter sp. Root456]